MEVWDVREDPGVVGWVLNVNRAAKRSKPTARDSFCFQADLHFRFRSSLKVARDGKEELSYF